MQADAPPFLLTRIQQAIARHNMVSRPKAMLAGAAVGIIILLNIALVTRSGHAPDQLPDALAQDVSVNNDIYR